MGPLSRPGPVGSSAVRTSSMITRTADLLDNPIRPYAWGSATEIPRLLGLEPTGRPQAELWMGAHPATPSRLRSGGTLVERIEEDPTGELSPVVMRHFGARLPFLMKIIAAERPLSLQAHPNLAAGPRRVRRGAAARDPDRLARAQLRRSQPQAGAGLRADAVRGAVRVPAHRRPRCGCSTGLAEAGAGADEVRRGAAGPAGPGRAARGRHRPAHRAGQPAPAAGRRGRGGLRGRLGGVPGRVRDRRRSSARRTRAIPAW